MRLLDEMMSTSNDSTVRITLLFIQFILAVVSLSLIASSFQSQSIAVTPTKSVSVTYGGPTINFGIVVTFAVAFYNFSTLFNYYFVRRSPHLTIVQQLAVDGTSAVFLLSAACAIAASDFSSYCHKLGGIVHCTSLRVGAALSGVAFIISLLSLGWGLYVKLSRKTKRSTAANNSTWPPEHDVAMIAADLQSDKSHDTVNYPVDYSN